MIILQNLFQKNKMISQTINRAFNILKLEKNTYEEISKDSSSIYGSGVTIFIAALVNVYLFKHFTNSVSLFEKK